MMKSPETRALLKDASLVEAPGKKLIDLQRREWDDLGIDQDLGCSYLNAIETMFPGDKELVETRALYINTAQRSFLLSLEDRQPERLERKKQMPRETIIEFFDACNTKMDLPETHERLIKHMQKTKRLPNEIIINIQRDLLEVLGYERDHGCAMLSRISQDYPNDKELHTRFGGWQSKAETTCRDCAIVHKDQGGSLNASPEFEQGLDMIRLQQKAVSEVKKMSEKEQEELVGRMRKKVEVFSKLPAEGRKSYMDKQTEEDRMEFGKAQVLLFDIMRKRAEEMQANGTPGTAAGGPKEASVIAPGQQQMM